MTHDEAVVFLDLDDVVCLSVPYGGRDILNAYAGHRSDLERMLPLLFARRAVAVLKRVHERLGGRVRYVLSSTWREVFDRDQMVHILCRGGLAFVSDNLFEGDAWRTPIHPEPSVRRLEIEEWLAAHGTGAPFAIVDDTYSGWSLKAVQADPTHPWHWRVVLCQELVGLEDEHVGEIVAALERPTT